MLLNFFYLEKLFTCTRVFVLALSVKIDELFSSYKLAERQRHTYTGVGASVKLQSKVLSGTASIARISGEGAAHTFQTLFTSQRERGPNLSPDTP